MGLFKNLISSVALSATFACGCADYAPEMFSSSSLGCVELRQKYGDRIFYEDFSKVDFSPVPREKITINKFEDRLCQPTNTVDRGKMEKLILAEAAKLGYEESKISKLSARDAIRLSADIVASRFTYADVDLDPGFLKKYGHNLPLERYFELGMGDCDKYSYSMIEAFNLIKKTNKNLENVHISDGMLGGEPQLHAWNSVVIFYKDKVVLSHLDPQGYDTDGPGSLEGKKGCHISANHNKFLASFFEHIWDFETSFRYYATILGKEKDAYEKEYILQHMAYLATELKDSKKIDLVLAERGKL